MNILAEAVEHVVGIGTHARLLPAARSAHAGKFNHLDAEAAARSVIGRDYECSAAHRNECRKPNARKY